MKRPVEPDSVRPERKNVDVERRADKNESEERPRRQNRGRRGSGPEQEPSTRKDRGRS
jgi:hypothetical protein